MSGKPGGGRGGRKKYGHKGGNKHYSDVEEIQRQQEQIKREALWREQHPEEEEPPKADASAAGAEPKRRVVNFDKDAKEKEESSGSSESSDEDDPDQKAKGVQHLISIENPNRVKQKMKKVTEISIEPSTQPSRREREAAEAVRAKLEYERLADAGKTDEARADMARLAIVKKQREEAQKKRDDEKKDRDKKEAERKAKEDEQKKKLGAGDASKTKKPAS